MTCLLWAYRENRLDNFSISLARFYVYLSSSSPRRSVPTRRSKLLLSILHLFSQRVDCRCPILHGFFSPPPPPPPRRAAQWWWYHLLMIVIRRCIYQVMRNNWLCVFSRDDFLSPPLLPLFLLFSIDWSRLDDDAPRLTERCYHCCCCCCCCCCLRKEFLFRAGSVKALKIIWRERERELQLCNSIALSISSLPFRLPSLLYCSDCDSCNGFIERKRQMLDILATNLHLKKLLLACWPPSRTTSLFYFISFYFIPHIQKASFFYSVGKSVVGGINTFKRFSHCVIIKQSFFFFSFSYFYYRCSSFAYYYYYYKRI